MAFTNYLCHSVILGWIFFGYGLGLFDRVSVANGTRDRCRLMRGAGRRQRLVAGPAIGMALSSGLWRSLMYGRWQPMVRA